MAKNILFINGAAIALALMLFFQGQQTERAEEQVNTFTNTSSDCSKVKGFDKIVCLADAFKATLKDDQLAILQLAYSKKMLSSGRIYLPVFAMHDE
jgi:hypothetical protein